MITFERKCTCDRCGAVMLQNQNSNVTYTQVQIVREVEPVLFPRMKVSCCGQRTQQELLLCPACSAQLVGFVQPSRLAGMLDSLREIEAKLEEIKKLRTVKRTDVLATFEAALKLVRDARQGEYPK